MRLERLPRTYWLLWGGTLVNRLGSFVVVFLSLYLTKARQVPVETAGLVVSLYGVGSFLAGAAGGLLADRIGRRPTMLLALFGASSAMLALGFAREIWMIAAITPILGFLADLVRAPVAAMVADVVPPEKRTLAYGYLYWAVNLGFSVASLAAGFLARVDYFLLFAIDAATTFAYGLVVAFLVPETRPETTPTSSSGVGFGVVLRDRTFVAFLGISVMVCLVFFQHIATLPVDMLAHGHDERTFGWVVAVNGALIVLLQPIMGSFVAERSRPHVLFVATLLVGIGFGLYAVVDAALLYALGVAIWTLGEIAMSPTSSAIIAEMAPTDARGRYQGAFAMCWGVGYFLGPFLGSLLLGRAGSVTLWVTCFFLCLASGCGYLWLGSRLSAKTGPSC
jgi:MFS family permease